MEKLLKLLFELEQEYDSKVTVEINTDGSGWIYKKETYKELIVFDDIESFIKQLD